jgi:predicted N-acyltransferase
MSHILHAWNDEKRHTIFENRHAATKPGSTLQVVEVVTLSFFIWKRVLIFYQFI